ncbi:MAG: cytidylate kinase family protein [Lachnospiraceae bacterium]|nr:cytidylate kinase family protein [Lachnospiraceae bacterium]
MMPIITIAKEKGINVDKIVELVAQKLEMPVVDKFLVDEIREHNGLTSFNSKKSGEFQTQYDVFTKTNFYNGMILGSGQSDLDHIRHLIVMDEVKKGPCIVVGKCARDIMAEEGIPALDIFVYSNNESLNEKEKNNSGKYDLALNIGAFGSELCADLIEAAAKKMAEKIAA